MSEGEDADPIALTSKGMVDIGRVVSGGSFGALALTDGKPRLSATKCISRCHLLVLDKDDWLASERAMKKRKTSDKVVFIKKIPIFGKLSLTYL
jgi:CRP-like cAMP-binding protein